MNIEEVIKTAEDLADSMQDVDSEISGVEWVVRDLVEYVRRHEAFKRLVYTAEHECREVYYSVRELWVSGKMGSKRFEVKYLPDDKWKFSRSLDWGFESSTHTHDEIVEIFEHWVIEESYVKEVE